MSITHFTFKDNKSGWTLNPLVFEQLNLLVGVSGAGKSQILRALGAVHACASGNNHGLLDCEWGLTWEINGNEFHWTAKTANTSDMVAKHSGNIGSGDGQKENAISIVSESLALNDVTILERDLNEFTFNGATLPRLKTTESAISLLSNEAQIAPVFLSAERIAMSEASKFSEGAFGVLLEELDSGTDSLEELSTFDGLPIIAKAFFCQREYPERFLTISETFREIFPSVKEVKFGLLREFGIEDKSSSFMTGLQAVTFAIQEVGVNNWVRASRMSSGMKRTLLHLAEVVLSPPNSVLLIDEYENGLGVNCLGELTDFLLRHTEKLQLILTSHHPYVIGNIPMSTWRIVTRKGSTVTVKPASSIPELKGNSRQDAFLRLINSEAFEDGLQ